ncbi:hypothetical protein I0C86_18870 [Plantactinospora sp. S1510]|uniref:Uncharacterized protein n=1 Tax=Plantactinospora alkalitolerans TaxID=2789879 RepID=A0ABS0GXU1_9ACTN|nr:hypothetical protein [Plantactinospora alkalitolerans]MBF9131006.1 hypothetical protein [Plantactinospora alkalitolerans]
MRQQDRQINDDTPDVIKSEPVPVPGPGSVEFPAPDDPDGRHRTGYPNSDIADHGPEDALDERGSYDNDLDTSGPGPWSGDPAADARTRDERLGSDRRPEERAEDAALDDDALTERTPGDRAADPDGDDRGTSDRGDLADASQADADGPSADADRSRADAERADAELVDTERADGEHVDAQQADAEQVDTERADGEQVDGDARNRPEFHEPAPLPTSFGAPTVGGAVAASALAGSHRDAREEDTVRSGDGPAEDRIDGVGDESERDRHAILASDEDRSLGAADAAVDQRSDGTAVGRDAIDGADHGFGTANTTETGSTTDAVTTPDAVTVSDTGTVPDTGTTPAAGTTPDGELLPGAAPAEPIVAILSPDTVQGLRDRWREVQLRFVDDPPGATADAHRLVEESVDAVTAALTQQREELGGWQRDGATDTEELRMVVRRHRDFLDRLLGS